LLREPKFIIHGIKITFRIYFAKQDWKVAPEQLKHESIVISELRSHEYKIARREWARHSVIA
jgi:hypothetical protein